MAKDIEIIKKPYKKELWTESQILEVAKCVNDPIYFIKKYIRVQNPIKGRVPLELYPYQEKIVEAFKEQRNTILLTGRQLGKCVTYLTKIKKDSEEIEIGSLIKMSFKDRLVTKLENLLIRLSV